MHLFSCTSARYESDHEMRTERLGDWVAGLDVWPALRPGRSDCCQLPERVVEILLDGENCQLEL